MQLYAYMCLQATWHGHLCLHICDNYGDRDNVKDQLCRADRPPGAVLEDLSHCARLQDTSLELNAAWVSLECLTHERMAEPLHGRQALILQHNVLCRLLGAAICRCPEDLPACGGSIQDHAPDLLESEVRQLEVALRPCLLGHLHAGQQRPDLAKQVYAPLPCNLHMRIPLRADWPPC